MDPRDTLAGRTVLVTGAGRGIGAATAKVAAEAGAFVITTDVCGHAATAAAISDKGGKAEAHTLDVANATEWADVVERVLRTHGPIHGLANVAGIVSQIDSLENQTEHGWDRLLAVDLKGPWLGMRSVLAQFIAGGGGKVINVASTAGLVGMPDVLAYSAAKGGVIAMSRQVAVQYAKNNIQVNVVAPGVTETPILGDITDELRAVVTAQTPMGRLGLPEEIARMIVHLLGPASDFITGQVISVDGGMTAQ
jgi:NAD(P)-dependent dehydrogenase (short-subunit alcohol dehydrogenase family)